MSEEPLSRSMPLGSSLGSSSSSKSHSSSSVMSSASPRSRLAASSSSSGPVRKKLKLEEGCLDEKNASFSSSSSSSSSFSSSSSAMISSTDDKLSPCQRKREELHLRRLTRLSELIRSYREHMKELHSLSGSEEPFELYLKARGPPEAVIRQICSEEEKDLLAKKKSAPPPPPPPVIKRRPTYIPRAGFISPVKYGENLQRTTPFMASQQDSSLPLRLLKFSREQLLEKCRQEAWVARRVQDLIREGLWSSRRLPKVAERLRPRVHWDSLLSEMTWMATDFHQERKWKMAAAKMLAHSAKEYVEVLAVKRKLREEEEEVSRRRRLAGFMASEVRAFWNRIHQLSELKLSRQMRVMEHQMLQQQLSYVTTHEKDLDSESESMQEEEEQLPSPTPPREQGPSSSSSSSNNHQFISHENGVSSSEEHTNNDADNSSSTSPSEESDDESTILEQELYEQRLEEEQNRLLYCSRTSRGHESELHRLQSDSQVPLHQLLRADYPGVLSEYLDLYDAFVQAEEEDEFSSSDDDTTSSSSSSSEEMEELELMTPPESGSLEQHLSLDSQKIRDVISLAEEAERLKPIKSTSTHQQLLPQSKYLPLIRGGELREYQRVGVDWLISMHKSRVNAAIGDEPGLGRKIMLISFLSWLLSNDVATHQSRPHLILVPLSSLANWLSTLRHWCPSLTVQKYEGSEPLRQSLRRSWRSKQVILTSYRMFFTDSAAFLRRSWNYLILSDAQNLGRVRQMTTSVLDLRSRGRLALLREPLPSNPIDLWNILYLLQPKTYSCHQELRLRTFVEGTEEYAGTVKKLIGLIGPFLLRRTRSQVEKQLPQPQEKVYILEMMPQQRRLYDDYLAQPATRSSLLRGDPLSVSEVLKELRLACDHPSLLSGDDYCDSGSSPLGFPRLEISVPSLLSSATSTYDPLADIDLNSLNFVFFTHETTLTVIISDRIRKSRASKALIEDLPYHHKSSSSSSSMESHSGPSVPCGRLTLEFQTSNSSSHSSVRSSSSLGGPSNPHILLSASVIKSLKSSALTSRTALPPSSSSSCKRSSGGSQGLGAFHKDSLRIIASFNERRCLGLPLYGKDLVDILTIVTCNRPTLKSMFRGMGLANTLSAAVAGNGTRRRRRGSSNAFRYQTQGLHSLVHASTQAFQQIHSESSIISKINSAYIDPIALIKANNPDKSTHSNHSAVAADCLSYSSSTFNSTFLTPSIQREQLLWRLPASAKLNKLNQLLSELLPRKERVVVFCEVREMRDLIRLFLRQRYYSFVDLEPDDSLEDKSESLLSFTSGGDGAPFVLLSSTRTSAIGLDISAVNARHIVLYDSSWDVDGFKSNPWIQSMTRRPGVVVHRLLCKNSVEESISRKSVQRKIANDLVNSEMAATTSSSASSNHAEEELMNRGPRISISTIEDIFSISLRQETDCMQNEKASSYEAENSTCSKDESLLSEPPLRAPPMVVDSVDPEDHSRSVLSLDRLYDTDGGGEDSNDIIKSMVVDLAELDPGCAESSHFQEIISQLDISTHKLFDNLTPIERFGMGRHFVECCPPEPPVEDCSFSDKAREDWERRHHQKLLEFEEELNRLENMRLLTYSSEDASRAWYGSTGQPMPLWPAPSPTNGSAAILNGSDLLLDFHLSFWYSTNRLMEEDELPPIYVKKESLKRTSFEAGLSGSSASVDNGGAIVIPDIKPKLHKKEESSAHAPRSLFDRPTPALLKARKDSRVNKFRAGSSTLSISSTALGGNSPNSLNNTSSSSTNIVANTTPVVNSAVAGIRNPLPRTQVEAENTPEWLIQEDWALHQAVEDLLELPLNLTVIHPGHTPNWDMVADMVNSVSRIYRGPRQCKNRYESIIVPREEGRILYDIIPPANAATTPTSTTILPNSIIPINNGSSTTTAAALLNNKKVSTSKKNKNLLKIIPLKGGRDSNMNNSSSGVNRPMKTSQLYLQDSNSKWTSLYRSRFESIKSVANKRTPTAKPILVNPTQKNPKHAAVLAESGISYEAPLNPIIVAQNRAERLLKEKQKSNQQQELSQQRIASAQAAAAAVQQTAAATARGPPSSAAAAASSQQQQQQTVVVGLSGGQQQQQTRVQQQQQLQEMVRSSNAVVVTSPSSAVVTLANFNRMQAAAQKVIASTPGRPLTPHQVNLLRQQAIINKSEAHSANQKLRMQQQTVVSGATKVTPTGVTVVTQAGAKGPTIRQISTPSGKTTSVRALTEQDMKILVAKQQQQQQQLQASGKVTTLPGGSVTAAQLFAQAGIKVQEGGGSQPVATLVKTVSAIGQGGQSVTIPVQSVPHVKAALARGQQMQMKLLQQQLLQQRKVGGPSGGPQRLAIGGTKGSGLPTQLIVQKNVVPHHPVTVQQILKGATPHAVLTKPSPGGTPIQARVIPASSSGRSPQTIQVVSGRGGSQFKVANSQQILSQVSAALGGQPVSMAVRTSDGVPVSVALRSSAGGTPAKTIITSASLNATPTAGTSSNSSVLAPGGGTTSSSSNAPGSSNSASSSNHPTTGDSSK